MLNLFPRPRQIEAILFSHETRRGPGFRNNSSRLRTQKWAEAILLEAEGPLEVFTQRNFAADFIRLKLTFIPKKNKKIAFRATLSEFRALRGNVRTPSVARCKARGRLYIRHNWTFFAISYGWDVMSGNRSKSPCSIGVGKLEWLPFRVVSKYPQCIILQMTHDGEREMLKYTGWAKKTGLFLTVCNSRICWHRITFYASNCSVFYPE